MTISLGIPPLTRVAVVGTLSLYPFMYRRLPRELECFFKDYPQPMRTSYVNAMLPWVKRPWMGKPGRGAFSTQDVLLIPYCGGGDIYCAKLGSISYVARGVCVWISANTVSLSATASFRFCESCGDPTREAGTKALNAAEKISAAAEKAEG